MRKVGHSWDSLAIFRILVTNRQPCVVGAVITSKTNTRITRAHPYFGAAKPPGKKNLVTNIPHRRRSALRFQEKDVFIPKLP